MYCTTIEVRTKSIEISVSDSSETSTDDKTYDDGSWDESEESVALSSSSRMFSNDAKDDVTEASYSDMSNNIDIEKWKILDKPTVTTDESEFSLSLDEAGYCGRDPTIGSTATESKREENSSLSPDRSSTQTRGSSDGETDVGCSNNILLMLEELDIPMAELYVDKLMKIRRKSGASPTASMFSEDDISQVESVDSISTLSHAPSLSDQENERPRKGRTPHQKSKGTEAITDRDESRTKSARQSSSRLDNDTPRYIQLYELAKKKKKQSREQTKPKKKVQQLKTKSVPSNFIRLYEHGMNKNKERKFMEDKVNVTKMPRTINYASTTAEEASDRLYQLSRLKQHHGRKRREQISSKKSSSVFQNCAESGKTISISKATTLYYRGIEHMKMLEKKQKEAAKRMDLPFKPRFEGSCDW